jgi:DeoR/GlpR family transcriptional regulator of sugar metabolism
MLTIQRKSLILDMLRSDGQVLAKDLAHRLDLSEDTIRRDLRELAAEGRLQRVHGGALPAAPALPDLTTRQSIATAEKSAIGRLAAGMVEAGAVIFLDGGTTTAEIARQLSPDLACTVVTHAPTIALALAGHPAVTVELIGGRLYRHSMVATGAAAVEAIGQVRADIYFMGVTGVHPLEGLTTGDREEAAIKRAIWRASRRTLVLMTADKADAVSPYRVIAFEEAHGILAARDIPRSTIDDYRRAGAEVTVA